MFAGDCNKVVFGWFRQVSDICHGLVDNGAANVAADVFEEGLGDAFVLGLPEFIRLDDGIPQRSWHEPHSNDVWWKRDRVLSHGQTYILLCITWTVVK